MKKVIFKFKEVESVCSDDKYYDLFDGGYLEPEKFLLNESDIELVNSSISVVLAYLEQLESAGLIEEM